MHKFKWALLHYNLVKNGTLAGYARHEQDEYSYVISGEAHTILEDGQDLVGKAGQAN